MLHLDEFVPLPASEGWDTHVILSPTAATWVDLQMLARISSHPVRVQPRLPHEQDPLPPADAVIAAPITFNSINSWAAGMSDTLALGILNESLGLGVNLTVAPCVKAALRLHPAYERSVRLLASAGAILLDPDEISTLAASGLATMNWNLVYPRL